MDPELQQLAQCPQGLELSVDSKHLSFPSLYLLCSMPQPVGELLHADPFQGALLQKSGLDGPWNSFLGPLCLSFLFATWEEKYWLCTTFGY